MLLAVIVIGVGVNSSNTAHGEIRPTSQPESFQTGGQMSLPILRDIATTLHKMDARLAKLEAIADMLGRMPPPKTAPTTP